MTIKGVITKFRSLLANGLYLWQTHIRLIGQPFPIL